MNKISYRLLKYAEVTNLSDPYFADEDVLKAIRNAGYGSYIDKYNRAPIAGKNSQQGLLGQWTRQIAGTDVKFPIIYYTEVYQFSKGGNTVTFLIAWKYNTAGNLIRNNPIITKIDATPAITVATSNLSSGIKMSNDITVIGNFPSYDQAKKAADADVAKYTEIKNN